MPTRRFITDVPELVAGLRDMFEHKIAFNETLGLSLLTCDPAAPSLGFAMRPALIGNFARGMLHGGVISAVLDVAGGLAVMLSVIERHLDSDDTVPELLARTAKVTTIDLRVDYLRPGLGERFQTRSEMLRVGSRVGVVRCELVNEHGTLIASAVGAYTL